MVKAAKVILTMALMLVFGVWYAMRIALHPFKWGKTWQSVAIGDLATDVGTGTILWIVLKSYVPRLPRLLICFLPVLSHGLTGGPMIVGQILMDQIDKQEAEQR